METIEQHVDEFNEELMLPLSINGMLVSKEAEGARLYQPADDINANTGLPYLGSQASDSNRKHERKSFAGQQQRIKEYEWIEMGVRGDQDGNPTKKEEKIVETQMINERRVTFNQRPQSTPNLDLYTHRAAEDSLRPHNLLIGGLPDVDYPTNEHSTLPFSYQPTRSRERPGLQRLEGERGISTRRDFQSVNQDVRKSSNSQSGDIQTYPEVKGFLKNLSSPVLRRRRPVSINQAPNTRMSKKFSQGSREASSSNSESDYSLNSKRNSVPSDKSSNSHRVLKLGSLKPNQGMFGHMYDRASPDPETWSEPEPELNSHSKRPIMKTQRSASIPNIIIEGGHGLSLHPTNRYTLPQQRYVPSPIPGHYPNGHTSPLDGLLERAKERRMGRNVKMANLRSRYPPTSPSFSTTPSPSPSDGDRDTEWEEEVELMRHRALTVSKGWKEQLVDGDEDDNRNRLVWQSVLLIIMCNHVVQEMYTFVGWRQTSDVIRNIWNKKIFKTI